jgi:hypothetical protein
METFAMPVERGCGTRKEGGVYAECGLSSDGAPIEHFLIDPPVIIEKSELGLSDVGVKLMPRTSRCHICNGTGTIHLVEGQLPQACSCGGSGELVTWHILDIVGAEHYPNVADWVEETRRFGMSRRLARNLDFSLIDEDSRIFLAHSKAHIDNAEEYYDSADSFKIEWTCPKSFARHSMSIPTGERGICCAGIWWHDVNRYDVKPYPDMRRISRRMPSFSYEALCKPDGVEPRYKYAIFCKMPISRLVIVKGGEKEDETLESVGKSKLRVDLVEE